MIGEGARLRGVSVMTKVLRVVCGLPRKLIAGGRPRPKRSVRTAEPARRASYAGALLGVEQVAIDRLVVRGLVAEMVSWGELPDHVAVVFDASRIADRVNAIAERDGLVPAGVPFTSARQVGWALRRLNVRHVGRKQHKQRAATRAEVLRLAAEYGVSVASNEAEVSDVRRGEAAV